MNSSEVIVEQPSSLSNTLLRGSSVLGLATMLERGLGFVANLLAARLGGTHVFGAYSIAMSTATNVASYAGAGIGTTANRFSGEYPYGSGGYKGLLQKLAMVCAGSALLAIGMLWLSARPLATYLIGNPSLTGLFRLASISSGAIILLECLRGLLIGQRRFLALLTLSLLFGTGMAVALPWASRFGAGRMVFAQALIASTAVIACILAAKKLKFAAPVTAKTSDNGPQTSQILRFGVIQLAGVIGLSAAGWWVSSMVARSDMSLAQAGFFSLAMQFRNICSMPPSLISQTAYSQLTQSGGERFGGAQRVTVLSTVAAALVSVGIAGPICALMPWCVRALYGKAFAGAELAAVLCVATGVVHMTGAPAAARLTIVSLRMTGMINTIWSILLVLLGSWLVPHGGAASAAACFLGAHLFSAAAVLYVLSRKDALAKDLITVTMLPCVSAIVIGALAFLRATSSHQLELTVALFAVTGLMFYLILRKARELSPTIRTFNFGKLTSAIVSRNGLAVARS